MGSLHVLFTRLPRRSFVLIVYARLLYDLLLSLDRSDSQGLVTPVEHKSAHTTTHSDFPGFFSELISVDSAPRHKVTGSCPEYPIFKPGDQTMLMKKSRSVFGHYGATAEHIGSRFSGPLYVPKPPDNIYLAARSRGESERRNRVVVSD
ncbi:uncharacterized protein ARMOST_15424 [Armillaria ostoyae]|uniref:Uncharacterized protein n=1 Tax=Armillaria ostoyae TaxID=47428 RepID=A0A284RTC7_ARMOS|nr:uncharacterized protein ARMOST_15424 [Armillaria ostoyae]